MNGIHSLKKPLFLLFRHLKIHKKRIQEICFIWFLLLGCFHFLFVKFFFSLSPLAAKLGKIWRILGGFFLAEFGRKGKMKDLVRKSARILPLTARHWSENTVFSGLVSARILNESRRILNETCGIYERISRDFLMKKIKNFIFPTFFLFFYPFNFFLSYINFFYTLPIFFMNESLRKFSSQILPTRT